MAVNLLRTAVGSESLRVLQAFLSQHRTINVKGLGKVAVVTTRHMPKRADELEAGGSLYWIVKNVIQGRQEIKGLESVIAEDGTKKCQIMLNPEIIRVLPTAQRAVQGWRYLDEAKAPRDLGVFRAEDSEPDAEMAADLRKLGLL